MPEESQLTGGEINVAHGSGGSHAQVLKGRLQPRRPAAGAPAGAAIRPRPSQWAGGHQVQMVISVLVLTSDSPAPVTSGGQA